MSRNYTSDLATDFEALLQDDDQYDVLIKAGQHPDIKEFRAHSLILRARCSYFKQAFQHTWSEKTEDGHYVLKKPNISPEVFHVILQYLYTGILDCGQKKTHLLIQCLIAADELNLLKLIKRIETYFCENPDVLRKVAVSALEVLYKTESFRGLADRCLEIIGGSPELLLASERFPSLEKPIMTMILHRDDLQMSDLKLWDLLTKWVSAHYLLRKQESAKSLKDLQKEARQVILEHAPLVGFYEMPEASFFSKVLPYRDLLPADLIASILEHHKDPSLEVPLSYRRSRIFRPNSVLLWQSAIFDVFAKWINSIGGTTQNEEYRFRLLMRGSRDGFDARVFHRFCDNKGATIVVTKPKNSELLMGGYTPASWTSSNKWLAASESFLFKLNVNNDSNSAKLGRVKNSHTNYAIYDSKEHGPCFGSGPDFLLHGIYSCNSEISRPAGTHNPLMNFVIPEYHTETTNPLTNRGLGNVNFCLPQDFSVQECEVFQVKKKNDPLLPLPQ